MPVFTERADACVIDNKISADDVENSAAAGFVVGGPNDDDPAPLIRGLQSSQTRLEMAPRLNKL